MKPPKTITVDQCEELLEELIITQGTKKQLTRGFRNGSMAIVILETGVRVAELCGLLVDDLWYADRPVKNLVVRKEIAKNKKERQIPISTKLSETIEKMERLLWWPNNANFGSFAFFAVNPAIKLTTRTVERVILAAGLAAFNQEVTPHMLRHTFATRMMRKTSASVVQVLLGHTSLQSTQIYMHPNQDDLRKAIDGG